MSDDIKKGLLGIVVDETEVSKVMPEINSLTYRGYAAQDLCEYCRFEEVAYLILNKDLPNSIQLKQFEKEERNNRELSKNLYEIIKNIPKKSHPMDVARTAVSVMGLEDNETSNSSPIPAHKERNKPSNTESFMFCTRLFTLTGTLSKKGAFINRYAINA